MDAGPFSAVRPAWVRNQKRLPPTTPVAGRGTASLQGSTGGRDVGIGRASRRGETAFDGLEGRVMLKAGPHPPGPSDSTFGLFSTHGVLGFAAGCFRLSFQAVRLDTTIKEMTVNKLLCAEISAPRYKSKAQKLLQLLCLKIMRGQNTSFQNRISLLLYGSGAWVSTETTQSAQSKRNVKTCFRGEVGKP